MGVIKKIERKLLGKKIEFDLKKTNVIPFRIGRLKEEFLNDYFYNTDLTKEQKKWAYKHGFVADRIQRYNLTEENYKDYMPDVEFYYEENYKNLRFTYWYDDKATTWYVLHPFRHNLPKHYFLIENNRITAFDETENNPNKTVDDVVDLLKDKKLLAFKSTLGGHGVGFYKVVFDGKVYQVNGEEKDENGIKEFIKSINGYIITEFVIPCDEMIKICEGATPVLRAIVINDEKQGPVVTSCIMRYVSDPNKDIVTDYDGSIYTGVKIDNGEIFKPMVKIGPEEYSYVKLIKNHPISGKEINGTIPNWDEAKNSLVKVASYVAQTPYLTFDFVPTDDGIKILEINSHGQLRITQPFYPFFKNEYQARLFGKER